MEKLFFFYLLTWICTASSEPTRLLNVECAPYIDHVATDPGLYRYIPLYVEIYRCHGKHFAPNPGNMKCLPKATGIETVTYLASNQLGNTVELQIDNHTACSQECVLSQKDCTPYEQLDKAVCGCNCNYTSATSKSLCQKPFVWQQTKCNCVCERDPNTVCPKRQEFSLEECGCTCKRKFYARCAKQKKVVNPETCYCEEPIVVTGKLKDGCEGGVNGAMLAVVILVEAFFIVFCYYLFYRYCYKQVYLARKNEKNISSGYYHNGDIPNDTAPMNGNGIHPNYDETYSLAEDVPLTDKERIQQEELESGRIRHNGISDKERIKLEEKYPNYYPDSETSGLTSNQANGGNYLYNDIMEVDGPPSSLDNHNLNIPPDYSDAISDLSEEGYGSVTQV